MAITVCDDKRSLGLALSGGGFRAALFHLGVLLRLDELCLLDKVDFISSVSGGSIVAGLYCLARAKGSQLVDFEERVLAGIRRNPRNRWLLFLFVLAIAPATLFAGLALLFVHRGIPCLGVLASMLVMGTIAAAVTWCPWVIKIAVRHAWLLWLLLLGSLIAALVSAIYSAWWIDHVVRLRLFAVSLVMLMVLLILIWIWLTAFVVHGRFWALVLLVVPLGIVYWGLEPRAVLDLVGDLADPRAFRVASFMVLLWLVVLPILPWGSIRPMEHIFDWCFGIQGKTLKDLVCGSPILFMNATCLETGGRWVLSPSYIGPDSGWVCEGADPLLVAGASAPTKLVASAAQSLSGAMLASASYPPAFHPYELKLSESLCVDGRKLSKVSLVDGGVFDNQGFRIFARRQKAGPPVWRVDYLIASDGSGELGEERLAVSPITPIAAIQDATRSAGIQSEEVRQTAFDFLSHSLADLAKCLEFALFYIGGNPAVAVNDRGQSLGFSRAFCKVLSEVRTDFDSFSDLEMLALMYHGYSLANDRITAHLRAFFANKPLPAKNWSEFNNLLCCEHRDIFTRLRRWKSSLRLTDFPDSDTRAEVKRVLWYLRGSRSHFAVCRCLVRLWDRRRGK